MFSAHFGIVVVDKTIVLSGSHIGVLTISADSWELPTFSSKAKRTSIRVGPLNLTWNSGSIFDEDVIPMEDTVEEYSTQEDPYSGKVESAAIPVGEDTPGKSITDAVIVGGEHPSTGIVSTGIQISMEEIDLITQEISQKIDQMQLTGESREP